MSSRPEGLRTSARPPGRLAARWLSMLDHLDERLKGRVLRGKTLARAGRVAQLELAPGTAFGEVQDAEQQRAAVRVRTFDEEEWARVLATLSSRLAWLALLLEGEVSDELLAALEAERVPMVPQASEIDGDCDCGDWAVPCAHGAALHHVLGEALDGEPFLLFTLRGRTREQLLSDLRRSWGDTATTRGPAPERVDAPPAEGDPFTSPIAPPLLSFRFGVTAEPTVRGSPEANPPAVIELGPLQGDEDLHRALHPLYEAGAAAALQLALAEPTAEPSRRRRRSTVPSAVPRSFPGPSFASTPSPTTLPAIVPAPATQTRRSPVPAPPRAGNPGDSRAISKRGARDDLTERIVNALAEEDGGTTAAELANQLALPTARVTRDLQELEEMGLVYRTGRGSSSRWFVG